MFHINMLCDKWNEVGTKEGLNMGSRLHPWQIGKGKKVRSRPSEMIRRLSKAV